MGFVLLPSNWFYIVIRIFIFGYMDSELAVWRGAYFASVVTVVVFDAVMFSSCSGVRTVCF